MQRKILVILGVFAILCAGVLITDLLSDQKEEVKKKTPPPVKRYVKTTTVAYQNIPTELVAYGRVSSSLPLDLITEVSGRMQQGAIPLKAGQRFSKGALLFKIDDTEARLRLQASKSAFLKDLAAVLPDFKIDFPESFEQWQAYFNNLDVEKPLPELPKHKNNKEKTYLATKNIFNVYYTIKSTEANLKKHRVYAPFSGTIAEVSMQIGSYVNPGSRVAKLIKTSALELNVAVEPNDVKWVKRGTRVNVSTETGDMAWQGKVVRIGEILNSNTQALDVFIQLMPNNFKVYEGMYLKAQLPGTKVQNAMEIPREALVENSKVYTLQDSLVKINSINIHKLNSETAIVSGLKPGAELIVEPLIGAYEDMKLFKLEEATAKKSEDAKSEEKKEDPEVVAKN